MKLKILLSLLLGTGILLSVIWIQQAGITPEVLYGSFSYSLGGYGPIQRLLLLITASCWIGFFPVDTKCANTTANIPWTQYLLSLYTTWLYNSSGRGIWVFPLF